MGDIFLRCAFEDDVVFLFNLVNDKECRENSFNSDKITFEEHKAWLKGILHSEMQKQYILMEDDIPVGQGRLEKKEHSCRISYSIIPERRGYGYGKLLVQLLSNIVLKDFSDCSYCYGEVLKKNVASQKIFEELGYIAEEQDNVFYFKKYMKEYIDVPVSISKDRGGIAFKQ